MLKKLRRNKKGFTLAELLIVVAIIAVLVAISIPIFTAQLKKARLATNQANARSAHAAVVAEMLTEDADTGSGTYDTQSGTLTGTAGSLIDTTDTTAGTVTTDPSTWEVDGSEGMDSEVYTTWKVTVGSNGAVSYTAS